MENQSFKIKYDGSMLSQGEMDVRELAPALLALGEMIEISNDIFNEGKTQVRVSVKGNFQSGSFSVYLSVGQNIIQQLTGFFNSDVINSVLNIREILQILGIIGLGGGTLGLLQVMKMIKTAQIKNIIEIEEGNVKITLDNGTTIETQKKVIKLYSHMKIRESLEKVITLPLGKDGIESFNTYDENEQLIESINKQESQYFQAPDISEVFLGQEEVITSVQLVNISFKEDNKRRLSDGAAVFYANVLDKHFLDNIQNNTIRFAKDDILKVKMIKKQWQTTTGIKTEYELIEVVEHRPAAIQLDLPFG